MQNLAEWLSLSSRIRVVFSATPTFYFSPTHQPSLEAFFNKTQQKQKPKDLPFNDGSLGSRNDEERRETRYVM